MATQEEFFNLALAQVIAYRNDGWLGEDEGVAVEERGTIAGNARLKPDILITGRSKPPIVIECEYSNRPEEDTVKYLGQAVTPKWGGGRIEHGVAVRVPKRFRKLSQEQSRKRLEGGATIDYAMVEKDGDEIRRFPRKGFLQGTVTDMVRMAGAMAPGTKLVQKTAEDVKTLIEENIRLMDDRLDQETQEEIMGRLMQWTHLSGLSAANVLWLDALLTQQELARNAARDRAGKRVPGMPGRTDDETWSVTQQIEIWKRIREKNWKAIFVPAIGALERAMKSDWESTHHVMENLIQIVKRISLERIGRELSLGAELFPKVTEGRKHTAAFYTRPAVADLLATLTIRREDVDWSKPEVLGQHPMQDLACGTGTLLRAGYRRGEALHREAGGDQGSTRIFHQTAMEEGIYGCDINAIATHMTSSSLAGTGSGWPYGDTRIGWVAVGGTEGKVQIGGLGFMRGGKPTAQLDLIGATVGDAKRSSGITALGESEIFELPIDGAQWTLMNPPYSRTHGGRDTKGKRQRIKDQGVPEEDDGTGQGAFEIPGLTEKERKLCQEEWKKRLDRGGYAAQKNAGMAASFACLAVEQTRPGGRVGLILPTTAGAATTWTKTRAMLERELDEIVVVCARAQRRRRGHDPALSADTGMEELMLVGEKRDKPRASGEATNILCVTLEEAPQEAGEGPEVGKAILAAVKGQGTSRPVRLGETDIGMLAEYEGREGAPWGGVGADDPTLVHSIYRLQKEGMLICPDTGQETRLPIPITTVGKALTVGPTHDRIGHPDGGDGRGVYRMTPAEGARTTEQALWGADAKAQTKLQTAPTHNATRTGGKDEARKLAKQKGHLFYARGMRWTSQKLLAATTRTKAHGGRSWTAIQGPNRQVEKAYALWFNSTLGMAIHWGAGSRQHTGRSQTQVNAIKAIPVPELGKLDRSALEHAERRFEEIKRKDLLPGREARRDETRAEIDRAIAEVLGVGEEGLQAIETIRDRWCGEASVHGGREADEPAARYESAPENVQRERKQRRLWLVRAA